LVFDGASEVSHQLVHRGAGGAGRSRGSARSALRLLVLFLGLGDHVGGIATAWRSAG
jgi:hypothetical protein